MVQALIFSPELRGALLAGRTERSLRSAGLTVHPRPLLSLSDLAATLSRMEAPSVIVRAGAWFVRLRTIAAATGERCVGGCAHEDRWLLEVPQSVTGRPLVALGRLRAWPEESGWVVARRNDPLRRSGGDFDRARWHWWSRLTEPTSLYLEPAPAHQLAQQLQCGMSLSQAVKSIVRDSRFRAVRIGDLDVHYDPGLRIMQLITSIQIGGAERVVLDLAEELNFRGNTTLVAAFGDSSRRTFSTPALFCDLSKVARGPEARAGALARVSACFGADVVHGHLIRGSEARAIHDQRIPLVISMHNMPASWPAGFSQPDSNRCDLILACAKAVERTVEHARLGVPVRTVWNGIDVRRFAASPGLQEDGRRFRQQLGWRTSDFVIVSVANPRKQKRLDRLPEIVRRVAEQLAPVKVRLLWAGETSPTNADAHEALGALQRQITRWLDPSDVHCAGALNDIPVALAAADVFISVSAYEGLSVAQLEAVAAGLPVVATAVGGTAEAAHGSGLITLLSENATAADVSEAVTRIAWQKNVRESALPSHFTRHAMARRAAQFYAATIIRNRRTTGNSVWLITNNFSIGGAQSSARRLAVGLHQRGVALSTFTIQEQPGWPTRGRRALIDAGVPCVAIPAPANFDAGEAIARLLEHAAVRPPQTVFFWNVIASYKVLLADLLLGTTIYDVSPGEMFFQSLASYFESPRAGVPYENARDYGRRLAGVVVKYRAEEKIAADLLGTTVQVIPNGVPLRRPACGSEGRMIVFGTAARLSPEKRIEDLIDAFRCAAPKLPLHVLRIAGGAECGDRRYEKKLRQYARGLRVEWLGELPDLTAFYDSLDCFVMISEPAGCPNVSLEAMAAGLPVIATDHGGASEQVIDHVTGRLVPRFAVGAFADALVAVAHNASFRAECAERAREHVRGRFSLERMIDSYSRLCPGVGSPATVTQVEPSERGSQSARISADSLKVKSVTVHSHPD